MATSIRFLRRLTGGWLWAGGQAGQGAWLGLGVSRGLAPANPTRVPAWQYWRRVDDGGGTPIGPDVPSFQSWESAMGDLRA